MRAIGMFVFFAVSAKTVTLAFAQSPVPSPTISPTIERQTQEIMRQLSLEPSAALKIKEILNFDSQGTSQSRLRKPPTLMPIDPIVGGGCMAGGCCSCPPLPAPSRAPSSLGPRTHSPPMDFRALFNLVSADLPLPSDPTGNPLFAKVTLRTALADETFTTKVGPQRESDNKRYATDVTTMSQASCKAESALKNLPAALKKRARLLSTSPQATACSAAVTALLPFREPLFEEYERQNPRRLESKYVEMATYFKNACLSDNLLHEGDRLSATDQEFLKRHVGLIVLRVNAEWQQPEPLCHAYRSGRFVITAQHCAPTDVMTDSYVYGKYEERIAFRYFDSPTLFGLKLRFTGTRGEPLSNAGRHRDVAVYEVEAPEITQSFETDRIGRPTLFGDFIVLQSNLYSRIANSVHSGASNDFMKTITTEQSILCRPAYMDAKGLFLHGCQTEGKTSGAPIFQKRDGRLILVGLHTGRTDSIEQVDLASCAAGLPNYGVSLPLEDIRKIVRRDRQ